MSREVRRLRRERDWTQADLGARIGVSRQAVVAIEGGGVPSLRTALALGRALESPLAEIFPDQAAATAAERECKETNG